MMYQRGWLSKDRFPLCDPKSFIQGTGRFKASLMTYAPLGSIFENTKSEWFITTKDMYASYIKYCDENTTKKFCWT